MRPIVPAAAIAILLLVGPGSAHDDSTSRAGDIDGGVAGTYTRASGLYVQNGLNLPFQARMQCDLEVAGDGAAPSTLDEVFVDGLGYIGNSGVDGTWDDGGEGGACHTNHYGHADYNSPGCMDAGARAMAIPPLGPPWISAACDFLTEAGAVCEPLPAGPGVTRCMPGQCLAPCTVSCGTDGIADAANFGLGNLGGGVRYPAAAAAASGCAPEDAVMMVFVFDSLVVSPQASWVSLATPGDIWQVA